MTTRLRLFAISLAVVVAVATPALVGRGQNPPQAPPTPSSAVITGVVQNGATGEAVPDAVVFISATPARALGSQTRQLTDERGRFAFVNLPGDATYTISATAFGYLDGGYGRDTMPSDPLRPVAVKADEWISNLKVSIWKPGSISGTVRDESGEAVVGVVVRALQRVRIQGRDDFIGGPLTRTDDRGAYRLPGLAPGRYLLQVPSVQASVPTSTALPAPDSIPGLPRPLLNEALDLMDVDDTQRLVIGRYPLPPPPVNGRPMSYASTFFPSSSRVADATTISLKFGEDRGGVDVALAPVASVRVSGTVDGPQQALRSLTLRLLPVGLENTGFGAEVATALVDPDGGFTFINVPAGSYTIDAPVNMNELTAGMSEIGPRRMLPGPPTSPVTGASVGPPIDVLPGMKLTTFNYRFSGAPYSGRTSVTVGTSDLTGIVVPLRPHATLNGTVVIDADPARPNAGLPERLSFPLDPAGGEAALGSTGRSGRGGGGGQMQITINSIIPGQYFLRLLGTTDWVVKSVAWNGRDYADQPFNIAAGDTVAGVVVTVTNSLPELTGLVRDTDALKANATMVIAFPVNPAWWKNTGWWPPRIKTASVSTTNAFRFAPLPAGDYYVAAVSRSFIEGWRDPEFLAKVAPSATRVTLSWSGKSNLDLQPVVVR